MDIQLSRLKLCCCCMKRLDTQDQMAHLSHQHANSYLSYTNYALQTTLACIFLLVFSTLTLATFWCTNNEGNNCFMLTKKVLSPVFNMLFRLLLVLLLMLPYDVTYISRFWVQLLKQLDNKRDYQANYCLCRQQKQ